MLAPTTYGRETSCFAGAYGLPLLKATPGYRVQEDADFRYRFEHPRGWVRKWSGLSLPTSLQTLKPRLHLPTGLLKAFVRRWSDKTGNERESMLVIFRCLPLLYWAAVASHLPICLKPDKHFAPSGHWFRLLLLLTTCTTLHPPMCCCNRYGTHSSLLVIADFRQGCS